MTDYLVSVLSFAAFFCLVYFLGLYRGKKRGDQSGYLRGWKEAMDLQNQWHEAKEFEAKKYGARVLTHYPRGVQ